jgi:hypothetical protein
MQLEGGTFHPGSFEDCKIEVSPSHEVCGFYALVTKAN